MEKYYTFILDSGSRVEINPKGFFIGKTLQDSGLNSSVIDSVHTDGTTVFCVIQGCVFRASSEGVCQLPNQPIYLGDFGQKSPGIVSNPSVMGFPSLKPSFRDPVNANQAAASLAKHIKVAAEPERYEAWANYNLKKNYGISLEDFTEMMKKQDGKCAICGINGDDLPKRLAVDHCHKTGKIRGLLCSSCNQGLGKFKDQPELLKNGAKYVQENS